MEHAAHSFVDLKENKFSPLPEDADVFQHLFAVKGAVYGGYLRDLIAGDPPNDIDVAVAEQYFDNFDRGMIDLGFSMKEDHDHGTLVYECAGHRKVEALTMPDDPDDTLLGPAADPDYDVNLLAYNGSRFYDWAAPDPFHDLTEIYQHIKQKIAVPITPSEARVEKIKRKGYTIRVQQ